MKTRYKKKQSNNWFLFLLPLMALGIGGWYANTHPDTISHIGQKLHLSENFST